MYQFSEQVLHGLSGHGTPAARALLQKYQNTQFVTHHAPSLHRRQQMLHEQTQHLRIRGCSAPVPSNLQAQPAIQDLQPVAINSNAGRCDAAGVGRLYSASVLHCR